MAGGEGASCSKQQVNKYAMLKVRHVENPEGMIIEDATSKNKRPYPSSKDSGSNRKISNKANRESSAATNLSTPKVIAPQKFTSTDKGPFKILFKIRKELIFSSMRSPSNLTLAHDLIAKYNIRFDSIAKRSKFTWIVTFANREQANNALQNQLLPDSKYETEIPWNAVFRRFVIRGIPTDLEDEYILKELQKSNPDYIINDIYRFKRRIYDNDESTLINTGTIKVTVRGQTIPDSINLWGIKVNTNIFIPSIRQCFKCGQLSHMTKFCTNKSKCLRCGDDFDTTHDICMKSPRCMNCEGEHCTLDKNCPEVILRKETTQMMAIYNIDFNEARRRLRPDPPPTRNLQNFPFLLPIDPDGNPDNHRVFPDNKFSTQMKGNKDHQYFKKSDNNHSNANPTHNFEHTTKKRYSEITLSNVNLNKHSDNTALDRNDYIPSPVELELKKLILSLVIEVRNLAKKVDNQNQNQNLILLQDLEDV